MPAPIAMRYLTRSLLCLTLGGCPALPLLAAMPPDDAEIDVLYGDRELYPSAIVCFTGDSLLAPKDDAQLGDKAGVLAVKIKSPADGCIAKVTFAECPFFAESEVTELLPKAGVYYHVAPTMRFNSDRLAAQKQPIANLVVKATVELGDQKFDLYQKLVIHSVNDWVLWYKPRDNPNEPPRDPEQVPWIKDSKLMAAAYVNENNAWIDQRITRQAKEKHLVESFVGYQPKDPAVVEKEVGAIYTTLKEMGFKYSNLSQPSAAPVGGENRVRVQSVRLLGDAMESAQANGVEGAAIMASVFRKMKLHTLIVETPADDSGFGHALVGVYKTRDRDPDSLIIIEPRKLGTLDFKDALVAGKKLYDEFADRPDLIVIDIGEARDQGILPIPEIRR
jgi:hypothetical protein